MLVVVVNNIGVVSVVNDEVVGEDQVVDGQVVNPSVVYSFVVSCIPSNSMGSFEAFNSVNKLVPIEFVITGTPLVAGLLVIDCRLSCDSLIDVKLTVACSTEMPL